MRKLKCPKQGHKDGEGSGGQGMRSRWGPVVCSWQSRGAEESNCQQLLSLVALYDVITLVLLMTCPAISLFHTHTNWAACRDGEMERNNTNGKSSGLGPDSNKG